MDEAGFVDIDQYARWKHRTLAELSAAISRSDKGRFLIAIIKGKDPNSEQDVSTPFLLGCTCGHSISIVLEANTARDMVPEHIGKLPQIRHMTSWSAKTALQIVAGG